ncbi:MAG: hypothetical protein ABIY70_08520 [Capsulimonas sp.]|uniref:hypothetical protein n=1 Tax=Capsulimonas sp. TaxID=2494211 RepID=UPI0032654704
MHQVTIKIPESTYNAARQAAESRGYLSVEEYVSDWLENTASMEMSMTLDLANALEEGFADSRANRVLSLDEHNARHAEQRDQWIRSHQA